jgi:hypothetical protein
MGLQALPVPTYSLSSQHEYNAAHLTGRFTLLKVGALLLQDLGVHLKSSCRITAVHNIIK